MEWCQLGSKYQLRVQQSNGSAMRFEGFDAGQHRELKEVWGKAVVLMRAWVLVLARGARARVRARASERARKRSAAAFLARWSSCRAGDRATHGSRLPPQQRGLVHWELHREAWRPD